MTGKLPSCTVAPSTKCNPETLSNEGAPTNATTTQPEDLITLSVKVLERNLCTQSRNSFATHQLLSGDNGATYKNSTHADLGLRSCTVVSHKGSNYATHQLRDLIVQVSRHFGGDDAKFLNEYINDVMNQWSNDLEKALACFRDLLAQAPINKWK